MISLIITTISEPNEILREIAKGCTLNNYEFIVIGDEKSPRDFSLNGCKFYGIEKQLQLGLKYPHKCPRNSYSRKNIGYLVAMDNGTDIIVETDDDNIPYHNFWHERNRTQETYFIKKAGWVNVYSYFTDALIWPRGFPLDKIKSPLQNLDDFIIKTIDSPIQQGLVNSNPDVDAIYRLVLPVQIIFGTDRRVALGESSWCPFNSQNTAWWPDTYPLLYLPSYCSFRMADIWRSFIAQRVCWVNGWSVLFHEPTMRQERNVHNLLRDFEEEIPGYINNGRFCAELEGLQLKRGVENIEDNLRKCYERLVEISLMRPEELDLLESWIEDLHKIGVNKKSWNDK